MHVSFHIDVNVEHEGTSGERCTTIPGYCIVQTRATNEPAQLAAGDGRREQVEKANAFLKGFFFLMMFLCDWFIPVRSASAVSRQTLVFIAGFPPRLERQFYF